MPDQEDDGQSGKADEDISNVESGQLRKKPISIEHKIIGEKTKLDVDPTIEDARNSSMRINEKPSEE
jgi:hypothetical protein